MSCNHCNTKFNFFHKELSCTSCGLSFCNKCLKQKSKVPNKPPGEHNVCRTCFSTLNAGPSSNPIVPPPPDSYLKRLEALENPSAPPITMYKTDPKMQNLRKGLSVADQQLIDRLEKLKEDRKAPPSELELRKRLANLKEGNNYVEGPSKQQIFTADTRSDQQKADALLDYFMSERDIDLSHNPQGEIEARLASLREQGVRPNEGPYISNLHDSSSSEEGEVDRITKKIMDEVALEERCPIPATKVPSNSLSNESDEQDGTSSPELPWCVLCNNDAKFRCLDCDGDLYCASCNNEVHKNWGDTDHKVVAYKPK